MSKYIITTVVTTVMGTVIGWLLNAIKTNTGQLYNMSRREHEERVQNRAMLGEPLFYRLEEHRQLRLPHWVAAGGGAIPSGISA